MLTIRTASILDVEAITKIYNEAILTTTATFDIEPKTIENRMQWFENRNEHFPILVACWNELVVGYAALNKWSDKEAYNITAEISIYVLSSHRNKGIGKQLFQELLTKAKETNLHSIIARITTDNEHSITMHINAGFEKMGIMKHAGKKFNQLLSVLFMQKILRE